LTSVATIANWSANFVVTISFLTLLNAIGDRQSGRLAARFNIEAGGFDTVKKLFILALFVLGGLAVWRKVQAQRADLDLWSEATTADDY
jgi:hypothetical protein